MGVGGWLSLHDLCESRPGGDEAETMERLPGWDVGLRTWGQSCCGLQWRQRSRNPQLPRVTGPRLFFFVRKTPDIFQLDRPACLTLPWVIVKKHLAFVTTGCLSKARDNLRTCGPCDTGKETQGGERSQLCVALRYPRLRGISWP